MRPALLKTSLILLAAASLGAGAAAQTGAQTPDYGYAPGPGERALSEEEWRDMVIDRTVYYEINGAYHGKEYYDPEGDRVVFIFASGECDEGTWREADGVFCFDYGGSYCFYQFEREGGVVIRSVNDGSEQRVAQITTEALSCQPQTISEAAPGATLRPTALSGGDLGLTRGAGDVQ